MKFKKMILSAGILFFAWNLNQAQVGINTPTPDPSAALDVESTNKGILIPRVPLMSKTDATTIPSPAKGLIVYSAGGTIDTGDGFYSNYGTPAAPVWTTWQKLYGNNYVLINTYSVVSTSPSNVSVPFFTTIDNLDLGLSIPVTIPPNSSTQIVVNYSTPVGILLNAVVPNGYMGIRFLKNGVEAPAGSRKFTIMQNVNGPIASMITVGATYVENITNNTSSDMIVTYSLNGYIERANGGTDTGPADFRFNMWDVDPNPNFNWGRGALNVQLFAKPL